MLKNYIRIAYRNFVRSKVYALINTLGLALSIFCSMLIVLWISDEFSYDSIWPDSDRIYRLALEVQLEDGGVFKATANPAPMPAYLHENYQDIEAFTRFRPNEKTLIKYEDLKFYESSTFVDSTFFQVFQSPFLLGNPKNALSNPNSLVITKRIAEQLFGSDWKENALMKSVTLEDKQAYVITGVIENLPPNTHFQFDILRMRKDWGDNWDNYNTYVYFLLKEGADPHQLSVQIRQYAESNAEIEDNFFLQSVEDIHLYSDFDIDVYGSTELSYTYVYIFMVIAIAIILIACINYMNLSTAQSEKRSKEIGLRKAIGSRRYQIIFQLLVESISIALLALCIALLATIITLPYFNSIVDKSLSLDWTKWHIGLAFITGAIGIGILAGSYPAFILSGLRPVQVLKGGVSLKKGGVNFRRILVVVQFAITVMLILGTTVVYRQFQYFMEKDLGYEKEQIIYLPIRGEINNQFEGFKNDLLLHSQIKSVAASTDIPTYTIHQTYGADWEGKNDKDDILFTHFAVGFDFVKTLGLSVLEGRDFSPEFPADSANYILNEEAVKLSGLDAPIGSRFSLFGVEGKVIGVVKDFNFKSLHQKVDPLILRMDPNWRLYVLIKVAPGSTSEILAKIENTWTTFNPDYPFEYHFLDEEYENLYRSEKRMADIFDYFTFFTLFIACLGLIGLINHMIEKRRKEISIRKVLGASVSSILILLSKEYVRLIIIAFVISIPIANYFIGQWLDNFAYSVVLSWWLYIIPGVVVLAIALLSVSSQTIRAARQNPVDNLRYE